MNFQFLFSRLRIFPLLIKLYLIGTFVTRGSYFMVWPFLSVILYRQFGLPATDIGLILGLSAIGASLIGFYAGSLSDQLGRKTIMLSAGLLGVIAFCLLSLANQLAVFVMAIVLSSLSRALWESPSKALIGDLLSDPQDRELALQTSYFLTNAGSAVGPLIGIWLGLTAQKETFLVTAIAYLLLTLSLFWGFYKNQHLLKKHSVAMKNFKQTLTILAQDHLFLLLIVANILVMFVYAHSDSSLIQYLTQSGANELLRLITALIMTNALTIVIFQFPLLKLMHKLSINRRIYIGLVLLFVSQLLFAVNSLNNFEFWLFGMFVLSIGEAILFPTMSIQIDRLAPADMRGSYFGATSFYSLGFASAPIIGGVIIDQMSGSALFQLTSVLVILVFALYLLSSKLKRPDFSSVLSKDNSLNLEQT